MKNKYNLDFYKTMEAVNDYLDMMEDDLSSVLPEIKNTNSLDEALVVIKEKGETILYLEDKFNEYLEMNDYQSVCNQLVMNEMVYILIRDVLPETDLSYVYDYIDSINEYQLIEDITRIIDKYNGEVN